MGTSIKEIGAFLFDAELKFQVKQDRNEIFFWMSTDHYIDKEGDHSLLVVVKAGEEGEYISIFSPGAYMIPEDKAPLFLQACAMIQWRTKLIQFEYDPKDGEVRAVVELPLEDSSLTQKQLMRCVRGVSNLVDEYDGVLRGVLKKNEINFEDQGSKKNELEELLNSLPAELLEDALKKKRQGEQREPEK